MPQGINDGKKIICFALRFFVAQCGYMDKRAAKDRMLRARCTKELDDLVEKAAQVLQLDEADVIRIGTQQYAASVVYRPVTPPPAVNA